MRLNQSDVDLQKKRLIRKFYPPSVTNEQNITQYQKTLQKSIPDYRTYKRLYPTSGMKQYDRFKLQYEDRGFYKWFQREQIKQRQMGNDPGYPMKEDVGRVAGCNGPVKLKQDAYGNYRQFNHPVMNSKGEGINKGKAFMNNKKGSQRMGKSGMAQQPAVFQAVQFGNEDQNFMPTIKSGYGDDVDDYKYDQQIILDMPQSQEDQMFDAIIKGEERGQHQLAMKDRDDRDIQRLFDERTGQPTDAFVHGLPPGTHPIPSEQRTMHSDMRAWEQGVMPLQAVGTDKPLLSQGMDAQQMYDLMQCFMIQEKQQSQDFTNRVIPGLDPGYDVR